MDATTTPTRAAAQPKSQAERDAVALCRAKWEVAKQVFKRREPSIRRNRRWLAGKYPPLIGMGSTTPGNRSSTAGYDFDPPIEQINTNLPLRVTTFCKGRVGDDKWELAFPKSGDMPDEIVDDVGTFLQRVIDQCEAARELEGGVDDIATVGPGVLWVGIDRDVVNGERQGGTSTPIDDLVVAAANGVPVMVGEEIVAGDPTGQPIVIPPGCDLPTLAKSCRDFQADPEQFATRTMDNLDNLILLAQQADVALAEEMDRAPAGYEYGDVWARRLIYGEDVLWDGQVTTSWADATWVGRRVVLTEEQASTEPAFKPSARKHLEGVDLPPSDGWEILQGQDVDASTYTSSSLCKRVCLVEFWDKTTGEVHYFTESGGYDGFLERDAAYPYMNEKKRPIFKRWFPVAVCVVNTHNLRVPERTLGIPAIEPGEAHLVQYILFDSAYTASCKKSGRIIEIPENLPDAVKDGLRNGDDCTLIERPATMDEGKQVARVISYGQAPVDYQIGASNALRSYARSVGLSVAELTGVAGEDTLGQEELAAQGARASQSVLIRKLEAWAGDLALMLAALCRRYYTDAKVAEIAGLDFVRKDPAVGPDGMPMMQADGTPVLLPSAWELFRDSSLLGDKIEARFADNARGDNLMKQKSDLDFFGSLLTAVNPVTGLPFKDPRPVLDRISRRQGFGRLKDFAPTQEDLATAAALRPPAGPEGGGEGEDGEGDPDRHDTPGGGRSDGRRAGGQRGPAPVPGRQSRGRKPGDVGDQSVRAHRMGIA